MGFGRRSSRSEIRGQANFVAGDSGALSNRFDEFDLFELYLTVNFGSFGIAVLDPIHFFYGVVI
jgi:hypothetical protein